MRESHKAPPAPSLRNGIYTVRHPERGEYVVKLATWNSGAWGGSRIVLCNVGGKFRPVAQWHDDERKATVAREYQGHFSPGRLTPMHWSDTRYSGTEKNVAVWLDLAVRGDHPERHGYWYSEGYRVDVEVRCLRCNGEVQGQEESIAGVCKACTPIE